MTQSYSVQKDGTCGFCNGMDSVLLYATRSIAGDRFCLRRCCGCRAVFLAPRPTSHQLADAYDKAYYGKGENKFSPRLERVLDFFRRARARRVVRFLGRPARVLDVGCGNGRFLEYLVKRGFTGYGIELAGASAERAVRIPGLKLKVGQLVATDFEAGFFDAVTLWHVLEHLPRPQETLAIIGHLLKPGGYLFLSLPNIESVQSRLFRGQWLHLDPPKHLFFLGPAELEAVLHQSGYELIERRFFSLEHNPFGMQQSILNTLLGKREVLFEALKGNEEYLTETSRANLAAQKAFSIGTFGVFAALSLLEAAARRGGTMEMAFRKTDMV
jgi:2-polyprenyl-3-methyl-5-hydroxy-6-metoxy-1,4-benzoquinol methylase